MTRLKIAVVTPRYAISGVPLAQWRFAAALAAAGNDVDLIIGRRDANLEIPEAPGVRTIVVGSGKTRGMFSYLVRYLRSKKPDIVFSAEDHLNTILLCAAILTGSKALISGSSRVTPYDTYSSKPFTKRWVLKMLTQAVAWRADALTCVSKDMVDQYRIVFKRAKHVCVYNIVDQPAARAKIALPVDDPWFVDKSLPVVVGAGTLAPWKGFDDLIRAVGILIRGGRAVRLVILGEGPSRADLEALVRSEGLEDHVRLPGRTDNPLALFARADVFALSSHVEGLPNVLVEAMMAGCTPVSVDCPTGPREVLQEGRYGYLTRMRDPADLAAGIAKGLDHPIAPEILAEGVRPFHQDVVIRRHFELLGVAA
jgi:glycosyltransferase involved in cell wall biosynthesis